MSDVSPYLYLFCLIFMMNIVPAFMPPTIIVLSFLYTQYHLYFIPTILLGVLGATTGRILLALFARYKLRGVVSAKFLSNYDVLGTFLRRHKKITIPVVLGYALSPTSSNSLFIIAGLSYLNLRIVAFSFFLGRLITYSLWVAASHELYLHLNDIFYGSLSNISTFMAALSSLLLVLLVGEVDWKKVILLLRRIKI